MYNCVCICMSNSPGWPFSFHSEGNPHFTTDYITEHPLPCLGCASVAELLFTNCKVRVQERDYSDHLALNFLCNNCKHFAGKTTLVNLSKRVFIWFLSCARIQAYM